MANGDVANPAIKNITFGMARGGVWFAAGIVVGKGWMNEETTVTIAGALLALVAAGWSGKANTNSSVISAASQIPSVTSITISDPTLAQVAKDAAPDTTIRISNPKESS